MRIIFINTVSIGSPFKKMRASMPLKELISTPSITYIYKKNKLVTGRLILMNFLLGQIHY